MPGRSRFVQLQISAKGLPIDWFRVVDSTENNINGILADEMGLGKTVQALAYSMFVQSETNSWASPRHHSSSTKTIGRGDSTWTPALRGKIYYGTQHERAEFRRQQVKSEIDIMLLPGVFERESNVDDSLFETVSF